MREYYLLERRLRMQLIAGLITENQYEHLIEVGFIDSVKKGFLNIKDFFLKFKQIFNNAIIGIIDRIVKQKVLKKINPENKEALKNFMLDTFETLDPKFTRDNLKLLIKKLNTEKKLTTEKKEEQTTEIFLEKMLGSLKVATGINLITLSAPLQVIIRKLNIPLTGDSRGDIVSIFAVSAVIFFILTRTMQMLGYGDKNTSIIDIGQYDAKKDIRK